VTAAFIDTNVLLYAVSHSPAEADKKEKALQLLEREDFGVSMQVVQEFYVNATHLAKGTLSREEAMAFIDRLVRLRRSSFLTTRSFTPPCSSIQPGRQP
jgi:predicted nucleic acid-binding protein